MNSFLKSAGQAIESSPARAMIVGAILGLAFPYGNLIPNALIIALLALNIFLSCFKINAPLRASLSWRPLVFCVARFALLPVVLWGVCRYIAPSYATAVLLLALCPAGVSSAALTSLYGGNVTLAFVITVISNTASVFLIPFIIGSFGHLTIALPLLELLRTMALCILLPGFLYLILQRRKPLIAYSQTYGHLTVVVILSLMAFITIAKKRDFLLTHPEGLIVPLLIVAVFYAIALLFGFAIRAARAERVAYGACSAFNNTALGVGLALLYFDEKSVIVMITTEAAWALLPVFVQSIVRRLPAAT